MYDEELSHLSPQQREMLMAANAMDATLLITGNTGTGKSHLAQAIHSLSPCRRSARFYKINLATLSENLIESELFGHERGAFTGADARRVGRLETCSGGTVFLDEIGELSPRLQAKLLDFIQYKKITPVGSNRETEVDVRIVAATNKNLDLAVKNGDFRADLYHRLNVFHIHLNDLGLMPKSVLSLARKFLAGIAAAKGRPYLGFSRDVEKVFRRYRWPGNIRELENVIEYCVGMESGREIQVRSLPSSMQSLAESLSAEISGDGDGDASPGPAATQNDSLGDQAAGLRGLGSALATKPSSLSGAVGVLELPINLNFHETREAFERLYLEHALRLCGGQINLTSRRIGLNKVSLTEKIRRYAIDWRRIRYSEQHKIPLKVQ